MTTQTPANDVDGDAVILTLFRQWREALHATNQSLEDDGGGLDEVTWAAERQIFDAPTTSVVDLAVKACMLAYEVYGDHRRDGVDGGLIPDDDQGPIYASDGTLRLEVHAARSAAIAAVHFVPELAPLAAGLVEIPTCQDRSVAQRQKTDLLARGGSNCRVRCALLEGDAGLIEAEKRLHELDPRRQALDDDTPNSTAMEDEITNPVFNAMCRLDQRIAATPAATLAGAAVKLRRLLHPELGMETNAETDLPCLHQILAVIEQEAQP